MYVPAIPVVIYSVSVLPNESNYIIQHFTACFLNAHFNIKLLERPVTPYYLPFHVLRRHHLPGLCCRLMYQGFVLLLLVAMVMALLVCGYIIYGMQREISQLKNEVVDLRTDLKSVKQSSRNYSAMHESLSQFHNQLEQTHRYIMNISATQATSNEAFHIKGLNCCGRCSFYVLNVRINMIQ